MEPCLQLKRFMLPVAIETATARSAVSAKPTYLLSHTGGATLKGKSLLQIFALRVTPNFQVVSVALLKC